MERAWTPRNQGNAGEYSAIHWLGAAGATVGLPLAEHSNYDLFADFGSGALRIQVKTSTNWRKGRFVVALCTRGGNQSWSRIVKRMDSSRCDYVFVHVGDGRRWFIPTEAIEGTTAIVLGGPKYSEYEVERGEPLLSRPRQ